MIEGAYNNTSEKMGAVERCKPDYEGMILRLRELAELIGELVTQCAILELELSGLVKRQEEDSD